MFVRDDVEECSALLQAFLSHDYDGVITGYLKVFYERPQGIAKWVSLDTCI